MFCPAAEHKIWLAKGVEQKMSNHEQHETEHRPVKRNEMSRRQFLSYTLGGADSIYGAGAVLPMVRFAVDPILTKKAEGTWIKVVEESKITNEPQEFKFKIHQIDGWYVSDPEIDCMDFQGCRRQDFCAFAGL